MQGHVKVQIQSRLNNSKGDEKLYVTDVTEEEFSKFFDCFKIIIQMNSYQFSK